MALLADVLRPSPSAPAHHGPAQDDPFALTDFEEELRRLEAVNQELLHEFQHADASAAVDAAVELAPADHELLERLRLENAELKARVEELEAQAAGGAEEQWLQRQQEYETLLEEKSEVIRSLHQKLQESQESALSGDTPPAGPAASSTRIGQAEEILRLKRELEEQRRQLEQDEEEMMAQMRQMELAMAKERAEMARQRQEVQRQQAELTREIEQSGRDPELRERLNGLRRHQEPKGAAPKTEQNSSGFLSRIFG
jgi:hypothetical protein